MDTGLITLKETADLLNCTVEWARQLAKREKIEGQKFGRDWLVTRSSVLAYKESRKPVGRPKKEPPATTAPPAEQSSAPHDPTSEPHEQ